MSSWLSAAATQVLHQMQELRQLPPALPNQVYHISQAGYCHLDSWGLELCFPRSLPPPVGCKHFCAVWLLVALDLAQEMVPRTTRQQRQLHLQNKQGLVEGQQRQVWEFYSVPGTSVSSSLDKTFLLSPPKGRTYGCLQKSGGS